MNTSKARSGRDSDYCDQITCQRPNPVVPSGPFQARTRMTHNNILPPAPSEQRMTPSTHPPPSTPPHPNPNQPSPDSIP
ncbi:cytochrome c heme lyase [Histoplasma capsulatum G186AR]|uniref:Cytochrome c heme lyase n=1 Tax=Ajellomyces capsulatus TaxID=5037 RepID=A0A8H8CZ29_AJECA|nr:cytochrome c heme lyase [Histoplasma capsulatum]QSS73752.1 cytochrome c heme lyase [Histoplasma capsulatum G186AR]